MLSAPPPSSDAALARRKSAIAVVREPGLHRSCTTYWVRSSEGEVVCRIQKSGLIWVVKMPGEVDGGTPYLSFKEARAGAISIAEAGEEIG